MTNEVETVNAFAAAAADRLAYETAKATMCNANMKKLQTTVKRFSHDSIVALLIAANVDANCVNESTNSNSRTDIYEVEKITNAVSAAANADILNVYTRLMFLTAVKCHAANVDILADDLRNCTSAHLKADKSRKAYIVQNDRFITDGTVNSQFRSSLAALLSLNVLRETSISKKARTFAVNVENNIAKLFAEKFKVTLAVAETATE